jgi:hypothetical protein
MIQGTYCCTSSAPTFFLLIVSGAGDWLRGGRMTQGTYYCTSSTPTLFPLIVRSRGLVKRWQDDSGNLLLHQFSPYFFLIDLVNEETPIPG